MKYDPKRPDIKYAMERGWRFVRYAKNGHLRFEHPACRLKLTLTSTPSDHRSVRNNISWIRRFTPPEDPPCAPMSCS